MIPIRCTRDSISSSTTTIITITIITSTTTSNSSSSSTTTTPTATPQCAGEWTVVQSGSSGKPTPAAERHSYCFKNTSGALTENGNVFDR